MVQEVLGCEQQDCNATSGGTCLEGFEDLSACPFYKSKPVIVGDGGSPVQDFVIDDGEAERPAGKAMVELPGVDVFSFEGVSVITCSALTRLIVIAGDADCGKTTLLASLSDSFQSGTLSGYQFAEGRTLIGFEKRCHLARLASRGLKPDTDRTPPEGEHALLHLAVRSIKDGEYLQDLLFTDISGETFRLAKGYIEECQKLQFLRRADHFVLLIDGEKLASRTLREEAYQGAALILRRCLETQVLDDQSFVDVVFTKYDLIKSSKENLGSEDFLRRIERRFKERYEVGVGRLRFFRIAARPDALGFSGENQLEALFAAWVEETPIYQRRFYPKVSDVVESSSTGREFDRYLERYFSQPISF